MLMDINEIREYLPHRYPFLLIDKVRDGLDRDEDVTLFERKVRLPDEFAGHAMVFRTFDKVSYALVMSSIKPTRVGYELKHPDAPY